MGKWIIIPPGTYGSQWKFFLTLRLCQFFIKNLVKSSISNTVELFLMEPLKVKQMKNPFL